MTDQDNHLKTDYSTFQLLDLFTSYRYLLELKRPGQKWPSFLVIDRQDRLIYLYEFASKNEAINNYAPDRTMFLVEEITATGIALTRSFLGKRYKDTVLFKHLVFIQTL